MFRRRRKKGIEISPDEILFDSENKDKFNSQQMEGVFERPISSTGLYILGTFSMFVILFFILRIGNLQLVRGQELFEISEENRLNSLPVFSPRGLILDRNGVELAWNAPNPDAPFLTRMYTDRPGMGILGYVSYPKKDNNGAYWQTEIIGQDGIEKYLHKQLQGVQGQKLTETNALLEIQSERITKEPEPGENERLTIDALIQSQLYESIEKVATEATYQGGAGVILDIHTGEILALVSYPSFSPNDLSNKRNEEVITSYLQDERKPFLSRATAGLYTPGSIVKPFIGIAALTEGVITENTHVLSTGKIEVPSPYDPEIVSTFRDWREDGHGNVEITFAIADSVNTFFYAIGGGYKNQKGIGINLIHSYMKKFGFGTPTGIEFGSERSGVIPNPQWKKEVFKDSWRLGDTYITSIGQFGFQVTPLQVARGMAALANGGSLVQPRIFGKTPVVSKKIEGIDEKYYATILKGLRRTVTEGTAKSLNIKSVEVAAKTGTAQVGNNKYTNSWVTGFFPYENPRYAFTVVMERGPKDDAISASWVMRYLLEWMHTNTPEYLVNSLDEETDPLSQ